MELAKSLLQVGVVSVAGTVLSILVFDHQQRVEEDQRARERRENEQQRRGEARKSDIAYREELLKGTLGRVTASYNSTKRARRKMRALGQWHTPSGPCIQLTSYDDCMADVNDAQLDLETIKSDVKTSKQAYPSANRMTPHLRSMERYLGELIEEYEEVRSRADVKQRELELSAAPRFADFIGPTEGSKFAKQYSDAHSAVRAAVRDDLLSLSKGRPRSVS
jgi:hypothetical protein